MENVIRQTLEEIENRECVMILPAVESGRRAWDFVARQRL
jgi:hypothetical protein